MTHWLDYTLLMFLALLLPIWGYRSHLKFQERLADGATGARIRSYRQTMLLEWGLLGTVALLWLQTERSPEALGLTGAVDWGFGFSLLIALAALVLLAWQAWCFPQTPPEDREKLRNQLGSLLSFSPHDRRELRSFTFLSIAAGICEEIVYRGYLIWLLSGFGGTLFAVLASSVIFALGHSYQGVQGMSRVFVVGVGMAVLYWISGSLWVPILLHMGGDILQGWLLYRAATDAPVPSKATERVAEAHL